MKPRTAIFNGRSMTATELMDWIAENRDYEICRHTMLTRMRNDFTGEDLVGPPNKGWRLGQTGNIAGEPQGDRHVSLTGRRLLVPVNVPGWGVRPV